MYGCALVEGTIRGMSPASARRLVEIMDLSGTLPPVRLRSDPFSIHAKTPGWVAHFSFQVSRSTLESPGMNTSLRSPDRPSVLEKLTRRIRVV